MIRSWHLIVDHIRSVRENSADEKFSSALRGVERLADFIAHNSLRHALFGWTSMADLCVQQTGHAAPSVAHLRISAQASGLIEFRYIDTHVEGRQWTRTEPPERAVHRFTTFLDQLHWVSGPVTIFSEPQIGEFTG
ncbi:hypothetical protein EOS93_32205 [Rhizobium sp. RMa-01]|uniref:hypothetical protein n=1 Tax=unclassified Rhizobium TaxID=2613769 RepID=UPI0008D922F1|nr:MULTISPECIES: hypothetical protein [unclassified Rhizobium]OHV22141.1 hypothetical protein BBJ66_30590 [Rhizobium sp. RSm-3]RVU04808.1 hypothetical protein EOS93_32205 [Rhizobium sp. RMa-01]